MAPGRTRVCMTFDLECAEERIVRGRLQPPMDYDLRVWGRFSNLREPLGLPFVLHELERCGLRATFFVEPLGSSFFGLDNLAAIVRTLRDRGHDVQLHLHPVQRDVEWYSRGHLAPPDDLADYSRADQAAFLHRGLALLQDAGVHAGSIKAFRAGNFGANNDTWDAMADAGLVLGSSYNPAYLDRSCHQRSAHARPGLFQPRDGVWELPITCMSGPTGGFRHLQLAAVSVREIADALFQCRSLGIREATLVSHSFEYYFVDSVERRAGRPNRRLRARLRGVCEFLRDHAGEFEVVTAGELAQGISAEPLCQAREGPKGSILRLVPRLAEQASKRIDSAWGPVHHAVRSAFAPSAPDPQRSRTNGSSLHGQNIVCFAKDWAEDPTSNNHVMRLLARHNRVLWIESIAARTPNFSDRRDLGKMTSKLRSFTRGCREVAPNLFVHTPIVLPFPHSLAAQAVNRRILQSSLAILRRHLGMKDFQLWTFLPTVAEYVDQLGASLIVYYCTDEFSQFSTMNRDRIQDQEQRLLRKADLVFATAHSLVASKRRYNPETYLASHGVDHGHFSSALRDDTPVPPEVASLQGPVLGFFGLVQDWIDTELLAWLAERRPDWNLVLIGKSLVDLAPLRRLPNVTLLGRRPYAQLPAFCKAFSVGLVPFRRNALTLHVNPIKLREYLSAGLPVVSTDLPEVRHYAHLCHVATTREAFLVACEQAIAEDTSLKRRVRSEAMRSESWDAKVDALEERVLHAVGKK